MSERTRERQGRREEERARGQEGKLGFLVLMEHKSHFCFYIHLSIGKRMESRFHGLRSRTEAIHQARFITEGEKNNN